MPQSSTPTPALVSAEGDKLTFKRKLLFAIAEPNSGWCGWLHDQLYNQIFVIMFMLTPATVSLIVGAFRIFDAFTDPLMGWISDRTRTRWGRRRPYIFVGAILCGLWLPVIWMFPRDSTPAFIAGWLLISGLTMTVFSTILNVPYQTLAVEMTSGIHERTSVGAYRAVLGKLGGLAASWVFWLTQLPIFADAAGKPDTLLGARWVYAGFGVLIIIFGVSCALSTPERFYAKASQQTPVGLFRSFQLTFASKNFRRMALITLSFATGAFLVSGLTFFLKLNYLFAGDEQALAKLVGIEGTVTFVCGMIGIPLFQWLSHRFGKSRALLCALGSVFIGAIFTWFLLTPSMPYLFLVTTVLTTPALTGIWVIVPSMNADVIDEDELANGTRRDGAFASVYSWVVKLSMSFAFMLSGPIVEKLGFVAAAGVNQAEGVILSMRLGVVIIPAATLIPALWLLSRYPLTTKKALDIQTKLLARRGEITA